MPKGPFTFSAPPILSVSATVDVSTISEATADTVIFGIEFGPSQIEALPESQFSIVITQDGNADPLRYFESWNDRMASAALAATGVTFVSTAFDVGDLSFDDTFVGTTFAWSVTAAEDLGINGASSLAFTISGASNINLGSPFTASVTIVD